MNKHLLINFLRLPEIQHAKYEVKHGNTIVIGNLSDFNKWINKIDKD